MSNFLQLKTTWKKNPFERYSEYHFLTQVFCQWEFHLSICLYLLLAPSDDVLRKCSFQALFYNLENIGEFESNIYKYTYSGLKVVLTQWFNLSSSVCVVKKLLLNSCFVTKFPFVALKSIYPKYFCIKKKPASNHCFQKVKLVHNVSYICVLCSVIFWSHL